MKILVLWSSPNKDGLTAAAKDSMIAGMAAGGAEVEEIHLNRQKLEHCRACGDGWGTCRSKGDYMLSALEGAGKQYVHCLANGFDMYY